MAEEPKREWGPEDEAAELEGRSIELGNIRRVRTPGRKSKTRNVNTKVLDDAFDEHFGAAGYEAKKKGKENENKGS